MAAAIPFIGPAIGAVSAISGGKGSQQQQATQFSESFVDPNQVPFLQSLFGQAQNLAGQQLGPIQAQANQLSQSLLTSGQQFVSGLQGQAGGIGAGVGQAIGGLLNFGAPGGPAEQLLGPNPALGGQLDALQAAIQQNLAATSGTIAAQSSLVAGGQGGSRQALATGLAGQEAQRQFAGGAAGLISQDFAARQALAPQLLGLQQGALGAAGQLGLGAGQQQTSAAGTGLGALTNLFGLGLAPFQAAFGPLLNLAQIIGPPTVLQTSQQQQTGSSQEGRFGLNFGPLTDILGTGQTGGAGGTAGEVLIGGRGPGK